MTDSFALIQALIDNIAHVIVGKDDVVRLVVAALLSRGHVLLEDKPGVGKTVLARALAKSLDCSFKRIQCTPSAVDVAGYFDYRSWLQARPGFANGPRG